MRYKNVILILTVLTGFVLMNPTRAAAEELPPSLPCVFYGTVQENGENVEVGTIIRAIKDDIEAANAEVTFVDTVSVYSIIVPAAGSNITFYVGDSEAEQEPVLCEQGKISQLDLTKITALNEAPVAVADSFETMKNKQLLLSGDELTDNDLDADGDNLSVVEVLNPQNGTVHLSEGTITFTPESGFVGEAGFDYRVSDGGLTDTTHVTIEVVEKVFIPLFFK